jgi:hypothetical protein
MREKIEEAARDLPPGAVVYIAVENGSAYIEASNVDDEVFEMDTADMTLEEEFDVAVQWCKTTTERSA